MLSQFIPKVCEVLYEKLKEDYSRCKRDMASSQRLCSSLHIAINSSFSLLFFDFADILILKNIKNLLKSWFSFLVFPLLM